MNGGYVLVARRLKMDQVDHRRSNKPTSVLVNGKAVDWQKFRV